MRALELLAMAESGPLDELQRACAELLRAEIRFAVDRGRDAPPLLLAAARRLETLDAKLSRETYLDAFSAALFAGRLAQAVGVRDVAESVLAADWGESGGELPRACDLLLEGVAVLTTQGYAAGAPTLNRALSAFRDEPMSDEDALRWLWLACRVARALGDDASWDELTDRQVRLAREGRRAVPASRSRSSSASACSCSSAICARRSHWSWRRRPSPRPPAATSRRRAPSRWPRGAVRRRRSPR